MNAKKCDRCGAFYETGQKAGIVRYSNIGVYSVWLSVIKDLCPSCYAELKDWFNASKEREENE